MFTKTTRTHRQTPPTENTRSHRQTQQMLINRAPTHAHHPPTNKRHKSHKNSAAAVASPLHPTPLPLPLPLKTVFYFASAAAAAAAENGFLFRLRRLGRELEAEAQHLASGGVVAGLAGLSDPVVVRPRDVPRHPDPRKREVYAAHLRADGARAGRA